MWLSKLDYTSIYSRHPSLRGFLDKNLPLHRAPVIESLRLELSSWDIRPENVRLWVEIAVSRHIRDMEISYITRKDIFPSSLFTCNSLVTLKLRYVFLTDIPSVAYLPSLKVLRLDGVKFVDEGFLQRLLSICPVLENLSVLYYDLQNNYMKKFTIIVPSLLSLSLVIPQTLYVDDYEYEIDTPSLEYLKLEDFHDSAHHYSSIKNMPKLKEAYVGFGFSFFKSVIESITSVKRLTICSEEAMYGDDIVFNQLEHLKLCVCQNDWPNLLAKFLKDSPNLRVLEIFLMIDHGCDECNGMVCWNQPSPVPECLLSSLQIFNWSRYFGRPQDRDIAVYILKNACHLKTATFIADTEEHFDPNLKMIKELTLSSRASNSCELVFVEG